MLLKIVVINVRTSTFKCKNFSWLFRETFW